MKKIICAAMAALLTISFSITAFAAEIEYGGETEGSTDIIYNVDPTYKVIIPEEVELENTAYITAEDVVIEEGKQVVVKLTAASGVDNAFTVSNGKTGVIGYTIKKDGEKVNINDTVLSVNPKNASSATTTLSFTDVTGVKYAGDYTGTVTFTVSVDDE